ncbi:MAG TPA: hypothetical protein VKE22_19015 [Haliangiales bacterium]|nr:hypothetical protein [Haliangiales bacterium]
MDEQQVEQLIRKLRKRGFITDALRDHCSACGKSAMHVYRLVSRLGGRDIHWCMACGQIRSFRRHADDTVVEDKDFDIEKFLS